jgi:hypothetical protein
VEVLFMEMRMYKWQVAILLCLTTLSAIGQTASGKFQPAIITAVVAHPTTGQSDSNSKQYDLSLKVGTTTYLVLFTPGGGSNAVTYAVGDELLVSIGSKTIAYNSPSGKVELPILQEGKALNQSSGASREAGRDYATVLALTASQKAEINPLLEQESRQVAQICANAQFSRAGKMSQYENIVQASDEMIKPLLSASQVKKLHDLRKEQKQDLKKVLQEPTNDQHQ